MLVDREAGRHCSLQVVTTQLELDYLVSRLATTESTLSGFVNGSGVDLDPAAVEIAYPGGGFGLGWVVTIWVPLTVG